MEKKTRQREGSPSVESLKKRIKTLQREIEEKEGTQQRDETISLENLNRSGESKLDSSIDTSPEKENEEGVEKIPDLVSDKDDNDFVKLDDEILEILGDDESNKIREFKFHPELVKRWMKVLSEGLKKESKSQLLDMYPRKGNCPISTPRLNPEIEAILNETIKRRDKYLAGDQELCGASLSSMGEAINMILNSDNDGIEKNELLKVLVDSGKLICELYNQLTKARKAFIYPGLDKGARTLLGNATTGKFLFGPELSQRIKTAKAAEKIGYTLKAQNPGKKTPWKPRTLNWKRPPVKPTIQVQAGYRHRTQQEQHYQPGTQKGIRQLQNRQPAVLTKTPR